MDQRAKKATTLIRLAEDEFGRSHELSQAEKRLLIAVMSNDVAYCGPSDRDDAPENNPAYAETWSHARSIRAELIQALLVNRRFRELGSTTRVAIHGAKIVGELDLAYSVVPFLIVIMNCALTADLTLRNAEVDEIILANTWTQSIDATGMRVKGQMGLQRSHVEGEMQLSHSQIGGDLNCSECRFTNPDGITLQAVGASVTGAVSMKKCDSRGAVDLSQGQIGSLICTDGIFYNPNGFALVADGILVKGSVNLDSTYSKGILPRFEAHGTVSFGNSRIGSDLDCSNGHFYVSETALNISSGTAGNILLGEGFYAEGAVIIQNTHISGALRCDNSSLKSDLDLRGTSVNWFFDDEKSWPQRGKLFLDRFVYQSISPLSVDIRLRWLEHQPEWPLFSQPYIQLARILGEAGDESGRIKVLIAMKDQEWSLSRRGMAAQVWRWPFRITAAYGYNPIQALWEILGLSALGWIVYRRSYLAAAVTPTDKDAYTEFKKTGQPADHHTKFSPLVYSLENSLPLVKLGQADKWEPDPSPQKPPTVTPAIGNAYRWSRWLKWLQSTLSFLGLLSPEDATRPRSRASRIGTSSKFVRVFLWVQILLGWLLATLFLAGISGIIKKE